jgi:hypothetical protein
VKSLSVLAKLPEVIGATLTDSLGTLLESSGRVDDEVDGAVHSFAARALSEAGGVLGLAALQRASLVGGKSVFILAVDESHVLGVSVDPSKPLAVIEKKIWDAITK